MFHTHAKFISVIFNRDITCWMKQIAWKIARMIETAIEKRGAQYSTKKSLAFSSNHFLLMIIQLKFFMKMLHCMGMRCSLALKLVYLSISCFPHFDCICIAIVRDSNSYALRMHDNVIFRGRTYVSAWENYVITTLDETLFRESREWLILIQVIIIFVCDWHASSTLYVGTCKLHGYRKLMKLCNVFSVRFSFVGKRLKWKNEW